MQTEIERKFLTTSSLFKEQAVRVMDIHQGYIGTTSKGEARVSIRDEKAWIIVKSNERLSRLEYEIPIPKKNYLKEPVVGLFIKLVISFQQHLVC